MERDKYSICSSGCFYNAGNLIFNYFYFLINYYEAVRI